MSIQNISNINNIEEKFITILFAISGAVFFTEGYYFVSVIVFYIGGSIFYYNSVESDSKTAELFKSQEIPEEDVPEVLNKIVDKIDSITPKEPSKLTKFIGGVVILFLIVLLVYLVIQMSYHVIDIFLLIGELISL